MPAGKRLQAFFLSAFAIKIVEPLLSEYKFSFVKLNLVVSVFPKTFT